MDNELNRNEFAFFEPKEIITDRQGKTHLEADLHATSEEMGQLAMEMLRSTGLNVETSAPTSLRKSFSMSSVRSEDWERIFGKKGNAQSN